MIPRLCFTMAGVVVVLLIDEVTDTQHSMAVTGAGRSTFMGSLQ